MLRVTCLFELNSPVTDEFPAQRASNAEKVSIWWRHHDKQTVVLTYDFDVIVLAGRYALGSFCLLGFTVNNGHISQIL